MKLANRIKIPLPWIRNGYDVKIDAMRTDWAACYIWYGRLGNGFGFTVGIGFNG